MTASIFSRSLGRVGSDITLIESPNVAAIGVGEGTTPLFKRFLKFLEVPEEELMTAARETCSMTSIAAFALPRSIRASIARRVMMGST